MTPTRPTTRPAGPTTPADRPTRADVDSGVRAGATGTETVVATPGLIVTALAGLVVLAGALAWILGADIPHAVLVGGAAGVLGLAVPGVVGGAQRADLSWRFQEWAGPRGSREDVARLADSLNSGWGYVGDDAESQLRRIARVRLTRAGLDLRDRGDRGEIEARIGSGAYRTLAEEEIMGVRLSAVESALAALETLETGGVDRPGPVDPGGGRP